MIRIPIFEIHLLCWCREHDSSDDVVEGEVESISKFEVVRAIANRYNIFHKVIQIKLDNPSRTFFALFIHSGDWDILRDVIRDYYITEDGEFLIYLMRPDIVKNGKNFSSSYKKLRDSVSNDQTLKDLSNKMKDVNEWFRGNYTV